MFTEDESNTTSQADRATGSRARLTQADSGKPATSGNLYYGWYMLPLAMLAMFASSPGQTYCVAMYNDRIREALALSRSQLAAAYTGGTILSSLLISVIGWGMDRLGLRTVLLAALGMFCGACLLLATAQNWWWLLAAFFFLRMLGPGTLALLSGNVLPFWFSRRLGRVESLRQLSAPASIAIASALNAWLLHVSGWRWAYFWWGCGLWIVLFPLYFFAFRNRPTPEEQAAFLARSPAPPEPDPGVQSKRTLLLEVARYDLTLTQATKTLAFWVIAAGTALYAMNFTGVTFNMVSIIADHGVTSSEAELLAAQMFTASAIAMACSQILGGYLADFVPPRWPMFTGLICMSAALLMLQWVHGPWSALLTGAVMGTSQGMFGSSTGPLWARYFGLAHLGKIRGFVMSLMVAASSLGPLLAGWVRETWGSFSPALITFALLPIPVALCVSLVQPPRNAEPDTSESPS